MSVVTGDYQAAAAEALETARRLGKGLSDLGFFRQRKDGSVQRVRFSRLYFTNDLTYLLVQVDTLRLPQGVSVPKLVDVKTLHHLSGVVGKPVHVINSTGVVYVVERKPVRSRTLPRKAKLDLSARPVGKYMLPLGVGRDGSVWKPLPELTHILIGGSTGGGKSTLLHGFVLALMAAHSPQEVVLHLVDTKEVELIRYKSAPWVVSVATEADEAQESIASLEAELERRRERFARAGVRSFEGYLDWARKNGGEPVPLAVLVIDELADLMISGGRRVQEDLARLAAKGRAFGIHMIAATQYPNRDVLGGLTKANLPTRIAFRVPDYVASQLILGRAGAEKLPDVPGRYIMLHGSRSQTLQGFWVGDDDISRVLKRLGVEESSTVAVTELSPVERELVRYAVERLGGAFKTNALFEHFRGNIPKDVILRIGRRFETAGLLTKPSDPTEPRMVTVALRTLLSEASESVRGRGYDLTLRHVATPATTATTSDTPDTTPDTSDTSDMASDRPDTSGDVGSELSDLERELVRCAVQQFGGAFSIGALYRAFREDGVSKYTIDGIARRLESLGLLTRASGPYPRLVTEELERMVFPDGLYEEQDDDIPD